MGDEYKIRNQSVYGIQPSEMLKHSCRRAHVRAEWVEWVIQANLLALRTNFSSNEFREKKSLRKTLKKKFT